MIIHLNSYRLWLVAIASIAASTSAWGQPPNDDANAAAKLPVKRIVLFNSGVGYFEHQGQVQGDATIDLQFNVDDVNDLLKSMVLQDLDGGQISTVTYGSRDPITKTLQTFAIDLTTSPTLGQLLSQIRGEKVEIDAATKIRGTIVGVETRREKRGQDEFVDVQYLNLLTDEGLRRIALDAVGRIKLANSGLDAELRKALSVLATGHATDKKSVSLKFLGDGERDIRVGYIQESPVWKTSYRLVLDDKGTPLLQGWAIVENTTETDWNDVRLSLVSGRPISFVMDLYSPLYADRPEVVPELYASLRPQVYDQDLRLKELEKAVSQRQLRDRSSLSRRAESAAAAPSSSASSEERRGENVVDGAAGRVGGGFGGAVAGKELAGRYGMEFSGEMLQESLPAAAQGADIGELFQYDIKNEVSLPRQRSAMLPIINDSVEGEKVSIYNQMVHEKHPLNGVRLKNSSDLHWMQGPVTVFDGGVYAGDARIPDLPPGGERLLSYALDLDIEVAPTSDARPQRLMSVQIQKGVLTASHKQSRTQTYTLKNSGDKARTVLVEHAVHAGWKLIAPQEPSEKTRDRYRFAVEVAADKPAEIAIEEEQMLRQEIAVGSLDENGVQFYLSAETVPDAVKDALREVVRRKRELAELNRRKQQNEQQIAEIGQEQERIRGNMQAIDRNTDLYNRYVKKFTDQEDQIEKLRQEIRSLELQVAEAQKALDEFLMNLNLP